MKKKKKKKARACVKHPGALPGRIRRKIIQRTRPRYISASATKIKNAGCSCSDGPGKERREKGASGCAEATRRNARRPRGARGARNANAAGA